MVQFDGLHPVLLSYFFFLEVVAGFAFFAGFFFAIAITSLCGISSDALLSETTT